MESNNKRFLMNPRVKRILQMVKEPSDDEIDINDVQPTSFQNKKTELSCNTDYDALQTYSSRILHERNSDEHESPEKSHKYDLRGVSKKPYQDSSVDEEDFSSDHSEYIPSPHRAISSESGLSLGEENIPFEEIIMQDVRTPSTISNLSEILGLNNDVDFVASPDVIYFNSNIQFASPSLSNRQDLMHEKHEVDVSANIERFSSEKDLNETLRPEAATDMHDSENEVDKTLTLGTTPNKFDSIDQITQIVTNNNITGVNVDSNVEIETNEIIIEIEVEHESTCQQENIITGETISVTNGDSNVEIETNEIIIEIEVENESTCQQENIITGETISVTNFSDIDSTSSALPDENHPSTSRMTDSSDTFEQVDLNVIGQKQLTRKRKRNENEWQDKKNKRLKNTGKAYIGCRSKKQFNKKIMGPVCKCKMNCATKFTPEHRQAIFDKFYSSGSHESQWQFIIKYVHSKPIKKMQLERKNNRTQTIKYTFPLENSDTQVCKVFFLNTLAISEQVIYTALHKYDLNPTMDDCRGKHTNRPRKMSERTEETIVTHIELFPIIEAHYVRKSSQKKYLCETLNISKMFRLYTEWFKENRFDDVIMGTKRQYETIFNTKFNYSFFRPKKDQCIRCVSYDQADEETKQAKKEEHEKHLANKIRVREIKKDEKARAEKGTCIAIFDMEKVLSVPKSEVGIFFYKRKYPVYNFTVFDALNLKGYCYMWHLITAKRGAIEVGSSLLQFIEEQHAKGIVKISFYSDGCSGQNKNRYVFALYQYAAKKFGIEITHRFFETGHSENEGDSMHSCIERALKHKVLYTPDQMYSVVMNAKVSGHKYTVKVMEQTDFYDIKDLITGKNWLCDINKTKIYWSKIKEIRVSNTDPDTVFVKYDYDGDIMTLKTQVLTRTKRKRNSVPDTSIDSPSIQSEELKQAYTSPIPVPKALYEDLMYLCRTYAIPSNYHEFYNSLICQNDNVDAQRNLDSDNDD